MIIGLTGGIACGKSTVAQMLADLGAETASADGDARTVLEPGSPTLADVRAAFPEAFGRGDTLLRAELARRVFGDADARARLEALMHPVIIARMKTVIAEFRAKSDGVLVYETPLLFEAHLEFLFDTIVAVVAAPDVQAKRLQEREQKAGRPALTNEEIALRLSAQIPVEEKARRADSVIRTDVSLVQTRAEAAALWNRLPLPPSKPA